jgi:hypothetical protein
MSSGLLTGGPVTQNSNYAMHSCLLPIHPGHDNRVLMISISLEPIRAVGVKIEIEIPGSILRGNVESASRLLVHCPNSGIESNLFRMLMSVVQIRGMGVFVFHCFVTMGMRMRSLHQWDTHRTIMEMMLIGMGMAMVVLQ